MTEFHVGDYGTALRLTVTESGSAVDISSATTLEVKLKSPDGRVLVKTGALTGTGSDGQFQYTVQSGDLDFPGTWRWQGYLSGVGGWTGHTSEGAPFEVKQVIG